jgi:hypothetical protein
MALSLNLPVPVPRKRQQARRSRDVALLQDMRWRPPTRH